MTNFEKLGAFYLGRTVLPDGTPSSDEPLLYDAKDLTTHALCVGMTGSGKTGLCIGLLEEAAIDGIPAIVIDPKGDIGNLLLTFPDLEPADFRPWIDEQEALRKGRTPDVHARETAAMWKSGIESWGQDASRIRRLREAADFAIYTPGSTAGLPLSVLNSFDCPPASVRADSDLLQSRIASAVSGLLGLMGLHVDPVQSPEHILLSSILYTAWQSGKGLDLTDMIRQIMEPPFDRVGVFDLDTFLPAAERRALALRLNNIIAAPSFSNWMQGEPLDISRLFHTTAGKPRISILSIAHLSESERMFFVTLLLNEVVAWMRQQSGTTSLRALLYMDEIFGFFPPSANPPSKAPMLTLLKQARAYGLGCVLATQNPVDLDYKGLGNTGTWFIGRLQTERDKMRVLDGLEGVASGSGRGFDRTTMDRMISGLGKRIFLMNNVHDAEPILFTTRWVLSYLRGPLTRDQISVLMEPRRQAAASASAAVPSMGAAAVRAEMRTGAASEPPIIPSHVKQTFVEPLGRIPRDVRVLYRPALLATGEAHFVRAASGVDEWWKVTSLVEWKGDDLRSVWDEADLIKDADLVLADEPLPDAELSGGLASLPDERSWATLQTHFKAHIYRNAVMTQFKSATYKLTSNPGQSEGEFRIQLAEAAREQRDLQAEKLRRSYGPKLARLQERIRKAEQKVDREKSQYEKSKLNTAVSIGSTLLGAFMGRKAVSVGSLGRAASTLNRAGGAMREKEDIERAMADLSAAQEELGRLEEQFQLDLERLEAAPEETLEEIVIRCRKADIVASDVRLAWIPWAIDADGVATPLTSR